MNTEQLLEERAKTHGDFHANARVFINLFKALNDEYNTFHSVSSDHDRKLTALYMMFIKLARIASTQGGIEDDWRDIQGYCQLVLNTCYNKEETYGGE